MTYSNVQNTCGTLELFFNSTLLSKLKDEHYDLVVTDLFFPCDALISRFLDVKFVALTTSRAYPFMNKGMFGFPYEIAYVPELLSGLTETMSFGERIKNVVLRCAIRFILPAIALSDFKDIQIENNIDMDESVLDVLGKASLWISYSDLSLDFPGPTMPNVVMIGGMAVKKAKALEKVDAL